MQPSVGKRVRLDSKTALSINAKHFEHATSEAFILAPPQGHRLRPAYDTAVQSGLQAPGANWSLSGAGECPWAPGVAMLAWGECGANTKATSKEPARPVLASRVRARRVLAQGKLA